MGGPARPLHEPGNHRSSERCSHRHSADCGSLIERPTLLRITAPTPRPGARSMPPEMLTILPGYDPDSEKNRTEARKLMRNLGYGPENRLNVKLSTRNTPPDRDSAVILTDQLKQIYIDAELEPIEVANWFPMVVRKAYTIGLNTTPSSVDDPDQNFYENYGAAPRAAAAHQPLRLTLGPQPRALGAARAGGRGQVPDLDR